MFVADEITILDKEEINDEVFKLKLSKDKSCKFKPGQFVNIKVSDNDYPLLRRPISVAENLDDGFILYIKRVGLGTNLLFEKNIGDKLSIVAPLGNGFDIKETDKRILLVGAGIGVAPLYELAKELKRKGNKVDLLMGFKEEPYMINEFKTCTDSIIVASENEGYDFKGYVTDALSEIIEIGKYQEAYVCGPTVVMNKVNKELLGNGINPQLLLEEKMACGFGACLVCTCKIGTEDNFNYKRTCKDGPVFYGEEVLFDE